MAKLNQKSMSAAAAAADTQREHGTTVIHQELPTPPHAELIADERSSAPVVSLGDPVEFIRDRVNSIELWRATVVRLNMTQLGVSLVRGVVRRGRLLAPPMRVFDTVVKTAPASDAEEAEGAQSLSSQPVPPLLGLCSALETDLVTAQMIRQDESTQTPMQVIDPTARQKMAHQPLNHHRSRHLSLQPSVARRALVHTASHASVPLYIGMLTAFIGHGVTSLYNEDTVADAIAAGSTEVAEYAKEPTSVCGVVPSGLHTSSRHLSLTTEMNGALHEVHRAAAEVMCTIDHEAKEMHALATTALQPTGNTTAHPTYEEEAIQSMRQAQLSLSCRRLSRVVANFYSLVSLLDFFAVEIASLPAPTPTTAAVEAGHTSVDFVFVSSASAVVATATAEQSAPLATVAPCAGGAALGATPAPAVLTKSSANAATPTHTYTTEHLHELFDASGQLPQSVWRVFSAAATTLSDFAVPWSLTTGDVKSRQRFNDAACAILGEDQRCLLLQLHRLCARFVLLRQRVYALHPISPLHFKVKQMLEWGSFLNADVPDAWSYNNGDIDRCDFHADLLHNIYARGMQWRVNSSNKLALRMAMTCPYATAACDTALRRMKEVSAFAPSGSALGGGWQAGTACTTGTSTPLALLASLASAGTNGGTRAALDGLMSDMSSSTSAAPAQDWGAAAQLQISLVPGYVGLRNDGNRCFLNSVVQLLGSAALFRDDLMARVQDTVFGHATHAAHPPPAPADCQALTALFDQYGCRLAMALLLGELQWRGAQDNERHAVLPDYLTPQLPPPFNDHRQHDASEFWHALMDKLDGPTQPGGAVVASWFSGRTATTMTCVACQHRRLHSNTFWDLSIPLLRSVSAPSVPTPGGGGASKLTVPSTQPGVPVAAPARVVRQVEVQHFAHTTAVTTTYASSAASHLPVSTITTADASVGWEDAERAEEEAPEGVNNKTAPTLHSGVTRTEAEPHSTAPPLSPTVKASEPPKTLQHLLLYLLHPALNMELLHGSNAVDCEHCHQRTDTEITTRLVAEVDVESNVGGCAAATRVRGEGSKGSSCPPAAAAAAWEAEGEVEPPHGESAPVEQKGALRRPLASTVAGSGLPYYLTLQLNRFAYQRVTHSCDKLTDGVPLNEVIIVPVYTDSRERKDTPPFPADSQGPNAQDVMANEEDSDADAQREDSDHRCVTAHRAQGAPHLATLAAPVWVAYRLRSIIIHSGPTPSSGHYFTLTRRPVEASASASVDGITQDEEDEHHASSAAGRVSMRTYVEGLGAALTSCLRTARHFSYVETAPLTADASGAEDVRVGSCRCVRVEGARPQSPDGPAVLPSSAGPEEMTRSPELSSGPMLPATAVSVSGDRLYENWVMLNDSNVQTVDPDTMRRILHGCGGGVYSSSETPYMILYEKVPVAYGGATESDARAVEEEVAGTHIADAALLAAARLRRTWVTRDISPGAAGIASAGCTSTKSLGFAPEVLQMFSVRLNDEIERIAALSAASHVADGRGSASTVRSRARSRPTPVGTVVHQGGSAMTLRANVARSSWPPAAGVGEAARAAAAKAFLRGSSASAFTHDGDGSVCRASQSPRPRRLMSAVRHAKVPRVRCYGASLSRRQVEGHHKHGDVARSSSDGDGGSGTDEEEDAPRC
ncbi:hypothetical protein LSCM1_07829 [Leishmania martiniquensis]|uniref:ubiquitinyl hydrolase 1 n=1 Tax=Leishmania martiniquensis TaxID=1580590 RepID=A0A836KVL1_9TRYP|nr:hypothetical protein LSCM1_07829 [Leishmania martiniquensis]